MHTGIFILIGITSSESSSEFSSTLFRDEIGRGRTFTNGMGLLMELVELVELLRINRGGGVFKFDVLEIKAEENNWLFDFGIAIFILIGITSSESSSESFSTLLWFKNDGMLLKGGLMELLCLNKGGGVFKLDVLEMKAEENDCPIAREKKRLFGILSVSVSVSESVSVSVSESESKSPTNLL